MNHLRALVGMGMKARRRDERLRLCGRFNSTCILQLDLHVRSQDRFNVALHGGSSIT
jgi:hypothetical protein